MHSTTYNHSYANRMNDLNNSQNLKNRKKSLSVVATRRKNSFCTKTNSS